MSYSILYDRQFVKLGNHYIPMINAGDNNVWSCGPNPKRSRDWEVFSYILKNEPNKFYASKDGLISAIDIDIEKTIDGKSGYDKYDERIITREEVAERFGYYTALAIRGTTHSLTAKAYRSFLVNGIKNALTIEQLNEIGINLEFYNYHWHKDRLTVNAPDSITILTTEDFFTELEIWTKWAQECKQINEDGTERTPHFSLQFDGSEEFTTSRLKRFRTNLHREKTSFAQVEVDHYYVLKNENGYLIQFTKYGYKYSYHAGYSCKRYQFEKDAERYRKTNKRMLDGTWKVERINKPTTFKIKEVSK